MSRHARARLDRADGGGPDAKGLPERARGGDSCAWPGRVQECMVQKGKQGDSWGRGLPIPLSECEGVFRLEHGAIQSSTLRWGEMLPVRRPHE